MLRGLAAALRQLQHHHQPLQHAARSLASAAAAADACDVKRQLLNAALAHVPQHGWSTAALSAAARQLQLSPAAAGMCARGPAELVEYVVEQHNAALADELATPAMAQQLTTLPLRSRLSLAVRRRLEMTVPYADSWPQVRVWC